MACKHRKPLNGQCFERGTKARSDNKPSKPVGKGEPTKSSSVQEAEMRVDRAVHGLVFNLLPDSTDPQQWDESVLGEILLKDNLLEEVLKQYLQNVFTGSIEVGPAGKTKVKHGLQSSPEDALVSAGTSVLKDRLAKNEHVQRLVADLKALGSVYWKEIKTIFVKRDWSQICVVIITGAVAGGLVTGIVDTVHRTKNDTLASGMTGIAGLIPETLYEVGDISRNLKLGQKGIEWKPSKGTWKTGVFVAGEWNATKSLQLKGRVEFLASDKGVDGAGNVRAIYKIGETYLDSVEAGANALPGGNYELILQFNKSIKTANQARFDVFIGAKYLGRYRGDPAPNDRSGGAAVAGIRLRFGD